MKNALSLLSAFTLRRRFWAEAPQTQAPHTVTPTGFGPSTQSASLDTLSPGQRVSKPWADEVAATNMAFNCVKVLNHGPSEGKELVFSGCQVRLSQLVRRLPAGCRQITVYADTLVVDTPLVSVPQFQGVVRRLDLRLLETPRIDLLNCGTHPGHFALLIGEITGGPLLVGRRVDGGLQTVSLGHNRASDLNPCLVSASPEGLQVHPLRDPASLCGQLLSPFAHNSLRASLSLSQALAAHPAVHAQAWARVRWVRSCLQALHRCCARAGQAPDAPLLQLYSEVTALADLLSNTPHAPQPCH